jgi:hypothetical protein
MERRRTRLGDVIDDYCTKCGLLMNHGVVGMIGDEVRKVRCNTCMSEHVYKHARLPKRKREANAKLFNEVLRGLGREPGEADQAAAGELPGAGAAGAGAAAVEPGDADGDGPAQRAANDAAREAAGDEPAAGSADGSDKPAPPAEPERPPEREGFEAHRRKLFTIRRHSGGKPPGTGTPRR